MHAIHSRASTGDVLALLELIAEGHLDFPNATLAGAALWCARLEGIDLTGASLRGADLSDAWLTGTSLRAADLSGADLKDAHLADADLTGADLRGASLVGSDLTGAILAKADLRGAILHDVSLDHVDLSAARLRHTHLAALDLSGVLGLADAIHLGPSTVGVDTLHRTVEGLSLAPGNLGAVKTFLSRCGRNSDTCRCFEVLLHQ